MDVTPTEARAEARDPAAHVFGRRLWPAPLGVRAAAGREPASTIRCTGTPGGGLLDACLGCEAEVLQEPGELIISGE
ncbi:hypothetical protein AB0L59_35040 [Streptomyces sp. NPDC052109]|uniref:hypothetical protein n=1 Tax=Streptomyces sp. NPDC052109 TaxID=3155527 RepID=UPI0034155A90